jgi:hypothetical protein
LSDDNGKRQLDLRIEVVKKFMDYLKQEEKKESIESEMIAKDIVKEMFNCGLTQDLFKIENKIKNT